MCDTALPAVLPPPPTVNTVDGKPGIAAWSELSCESLEVETCDYANPCSAGTCVFYDRGQGYANARGICDEGSSRAGVHSYQAGACLASLAPATQAGLCCVHAPGVDCRPWPFTTPGGVHDACIKHADCEAGLLCMAVENAANQNGVCACPGSEPLITSYDPPCSARAYDADGHKLEPMAPAQCRAADAQGWIVQGVLAAPGRSQLVAKIDQRNATHVLASAEGVFHHATDASGDFPAQAQTCSGSSWQAADLTFDGSGAAHALIAQVPFSLGHEGSWSPEATLPIYDNGQLGIDTSGALVVGLAEGLMRRDSDGKIQFMPLPGIASSASWLQQVEGGNLRHGPEFMPLNLRWFGLGTKPTRVYMVDPVAPAQALHVDEADADLTRVSSRTLAVPALDYPLYALDAGTLHIVGKPRTESRLVHFYEDSGGLHHEDIPLQGASFDTLAFAARGERALVAMCAEDGVHVALREAGVWSERLISRQTCRFTSDDDLAAPSWHEMEAAIASDGSPRIIFASWGFADIPTVRMLRQGACP